ncbi:MULTISPECIES: DUF2573 family protein [Paenibacillus]|uniref:DUF2573 family protein n=1 Tax=Paenibacillus TaxID=44249 RepID=UPI0022B8D228|nr:DUF2573 family protein [Paenibacillus caseinilyticus]MCZ8519226.1 DUF2573 family protein [Paenibacillus caseinilyticus]
MNPQALDEFEGLVSKFSELLIGDTSAEHIEKIKIWAVYSHIHRTMPALTSHWNQLHPGIKAEMRTLFEEVRSLNQKLKEDNQKPQDGQEGSGSAAAQES